MSGESLMRRRVCEALRGLDPVSVENPAHPGTPDVNCSGGWIELKRIEAWPVRQTSPLRVPHFTSQQRVWLTRRWRCDQRAWLLLLVGQHPECEWLMFGGETAAKIVGTSTRADLREQATRLWMPTLIDAELRALVQR